MPAGDAVGGDDNHVDMLTLHHIHDVPCHVIPNFDAGSCLDSPGRKSCMAFGQMPLRKCSRILDKFGFGNQVRESGSGEKGDDVHKVEFGMKVNLSDRKSTRLNSSHANISYA